MLNGTLAQSEDTEVKKKKKKKKRKNNKTAPTEGEGDGDGQFELPPLAWGTPPGTLNGFPGSGGGTPRRLEPLGPPRLGGIVSKLFSPFTPDSAKSNTDTNSTTLKHSKALLNSFPMNDHSLGF